MIIVNESTTGASIKIEETLEYLPHIDQHWTFKDCFLDFNSQRNSVTIINRINDST